MDPYEVVCLRSHSAAFHFDFLASRFSLWHKNGSNSVDVSVHPVFIHSSSLAVLGWASCETVLFFFFFLFLLYCLTHTQPISVEISTVGLLRPRTGRRRGLSQTRMNPEQEQRSVPCSRTFQPLDWQGRKIFHSHFSTLTWNSNQQPPLDPSLLLPRILLFTVKVRKREDGQVVYWEQKW